ncbi:MAG: endonuclease III [Eubacteriales bacterium]|nr:endonuclease III [Eubacteriales bacterium]
MKKRTKEILARFDEVYGTEPVCYLHYNTPWQLLVATMLSAQCTDDNVNRVTVGLFQKYDTLEKLAAADPVQLEQDIRSIGLFRSKAKNILATAGLLLSRHGGELPSDIDSLVALPGVGRKTANVVRTHIFKIPSVVVDTHVKRIAGKLKLTKEEDPVKIEHELMKEVDEAHWSLINTQFIAFGRAICQARSPKCELCFVRDYCKEGKKR